MKRSRKEKPKGKREREREREDKGERKEGTGETIRGKATKGTNASQGCVTKRGDLPWVLNVWIIQHRQKNTGTGDHQVYKQQNKDTERKNSKEQANI